MEEEGGEEREGRERLVWEVARIAHPIPRRVELQRPESAPARLRGGRDAPLPWSPPCAPVRPGTEAGSPGTTQTQTQQAPKPTPSRTLQRALGEDKGAQRRAAQRPELSGTWRASSPQRFCSPLPGWTPLLAALVTVLRLGFAFFHL